MNSQFANHSLDRGRRHSMSQQLRNGDDFPEQRQDSHPDFSSPENFFARFYFFPPSLTAPGSPRMQGTASCSSVRQMDEEKSAELFTVLEEGSVFEFGNRSLHVLHLPGHSRGSIGLIYQRARGSCSLEVWCMPCACFCFRFFRAYQPPACIHLTNRFYVAVHLFNNRSQMTS